MKYVLLAAVPGFFALNPITGRALASVIGPWALTSIRWFLAALIVGLIAWWRGARERWRLPLNDLIRVGLLATLGMAFCSYAAYAGAKYATATTVGLLYACTTALVAGYEITRGALRLTPALAFGIVCCLVGVALVLTRGDISALAKLDIGRGEAIAAAGTIAWAIYTVKLKTIPNSLTPFARFTLMSAAACLASLPFTAFELAYLQTPTLDATAAPWIAALVLIASVLAFMGYSWSMQFNGPVLTAASIALSPLYIAVLSVVLIGETIAWFHITAIVLVIAGLFAINWQQARNA